MNKVLPVSLAVHPVFTEREINFIVYENEEYLFRLVPTPNGFIPSKTDQTFGICYDAKMIACLTDFIFQNEL